MTSSQQPMDDAGRKRHLEALFADEPFLSPTMKARRMHEKMMEMRAREEVSNGRAVATAVVPDLKYSAGMLDEPEFLRASASPPNSRRLSFEEAAKRLAGRTESGFSFGAQDQITQFKTQVLSKWVQRVGPRETSAPSRADRSVSPTPRGLNRYTEENQR